MKKNTLYIGLCYLTVGICAILFGLFGPSIGNDGIIGGIAGAGIVPGIYMIYKYFYWSKPENKPKYEEKLKKERINLKDERKIMLREKSGRITYIILFYILAVLIPLFAIMNIDRIVVITLGIIWIFMYVCGIVVFRILDKRL
ncbi:Uncharacterised protein [uncultured Clostridium sp.]|nr:Uncharacterised protein [uncultured Clostridium sp.]SCJ47443.1 Uncharacterised protein [uncultured Clostridium sp.]